MESIIKITRDINYTLTKKRPKTYHVFMEMLAWIF